MQIRISRFMLCAIFTRQHGNNGIQIIKIQPENWCVWNESRVELNYREMKYFFIADRFLFSPPHPASPIMNS
jgi:hypothetical protein